MKTLTDLQNELSPDAQRKLGGKFDTGGTWYNSLLPSLALSCMRAGHSQEDYLRLIQNSKVAVALAGTTRYGTPAKAESLMISQWDWAEEEYNPDTAELIRGKLAALVKPVFLASCWSKGAAGITERAVALSILNLAIYRGAYTMGLSVRHLSVSAGVDDVATVTKVRKRLVKVGLLKYAGYETGARFNVTMDWAPPVRPNVPMPYKVLLGKYLHCMAYAHPVWFRSGLGPVAGWVWATLDDEAWSVTDIVTLLGVGRKAVTSACTALVGAGLAVQEGKRYRVVAATDDQLDGIAGPSLLGWRDRKAAVYDLDREMYAEARAEWAATTADPGVPAPHYCNPFSDLPCCTGVPA